MNINIYIYTLHVLFFTKSTSQTLGISHVSDSRVADLEQTLSIVQTAQEWTLGKGRGFTAASSLTDNPMTYISYITYMMYTEYSDNI